MDNVINVELRTENSRRAHFNRVGDWRPRYIIWPKERFVTQEVEDEWGEIVAGTVSEFCRIQSLTCIPYRRIDEDTASLASRIARVFNYYPRLRFEDPTCALTADYVNQRQHWGHEDVIYLLASTRPTQQQFQLIEYAPVLDRASLLPYGTAILALGTEETVVENAFSEHEEVFLDALSACAKKLGHLVEHTAVHFLSHWVIANKESFGPRWDEF
jgi:hypothetical protein